MNAQEPSVTQDTGTSNAARIRRQSPGFTLVELLVVIAIIGVLIALLLPAVQAARESARRVQCANNLKQLALAALSYEAAEGVLPPSGIVGNDTRTFGKRKYPVFNQRSGPMIGWAVLLLPYFEQDNLYDQFDLKKSVLAQSGEPQAKFIETLMCPSDSAGGRYYGDPTYTNGKLFAKGNYAAYVSPYHTDAQLLYPGALISTGQKLKQITDGTSATLVFSEVRTIDIANDERGAWALPWNGATLLSFDMHHDKDKAGYFGPYTPWNVERIVEQVQLPNFLGPNSDILLRCSDETLAQAELERMPCDRWRWGLGLFGYSSAAPRSHHPGGVDASYLDGHVDFLPDDVDPFVMAYLIDVNGSEAVSLARN